MGGRGGACTAPAAPPAPPAAHQQVRLRVTPRRNHPACGAGTHSHRRRRPGQNGRLVHSGGFWKVFSGHGAHSPTLQHLRLCCAIKFWLPSPPHPLPDSSASQPGRCRTCGTPVPAVGTPGRIVPCAGERQCLAIPVGGPSASPWTAEGGRTVVAQPCAWAWPLWGEAGRHSLHQGPSWQPVPSLGHAGGSLGARPGLGAAGSCNVECGPVVQ